VFAVALGLRQWRRGRFLRQWRMVVVSDGFKGCAKETFLGLFWCMGIDKLWCGGVMEG